MVDLKVQIGVVVGGGNIFRGLEASAQGIDRAVADNMGMLATVINALALQDALEKAGVPTRVMSAITMNEVAEPYIRRRAMRHLEKGRIVVFGAGTGSPYFTTDTAAALRATEIGAEAILKGTRVAGIYDRDPEKDGKAQMIPRLTYFEVLEKSLRVMDSTAITMAMEQNIPIIVFKLLEPGNMKKSGARRDGGHHRGEARPMKDEVLNETRRKMDKVLEAMARDLSRVRTGRASVALLEGIKVDCYGTTMPLAQVASLAAPESRLLTVQPWDTSVMGDIEKAILKSDLGLNPVNDGKIIRLPIPALTTERRKDLVKMVKKMEEEAKVALRNVRREANEDFKEMKKEKLLAEDDAHRGTEEVQKITDEYIKKAEAQAAEKEKEIMSF